MMKIYKLFLTVAWAITFTAISFGQTPGITVSDRTLIFRFVPGEDMFYIPWEGNGEELNRLYSLVDEYRENIMDGTMPVYVDGYCASMKSAAENLQTAYIRANRVKSELIMQKNLLERHFITKNYATPYIDGDGQSHRDLVVVTLRIPAQPEPLLQPVTEQPEETETPVRVEPEPEPVTIPQEEPAVTVARPVASPQPYILALRTNLLYDAFLIPTLGVEWRVNRDLGIKLDGSRSWWSSGDGRVQKIWLVNPEVRWYLLNAKRFYVGASGTFGEYNIYKYPVGGLLSSDTGYQGKVWNAGVTVDYQLYLSRSVSLDFNLGMGYTRSEYDNFTVTEGVRIYKEKDKTKNFFGPTQAGINLVWTIGGQR